MSFRLAAYAVCVEDGRVLLARHVPDSRVIPAATARAGVEHQNVGVFYRVRITGGPLRPEPNGEIAESVWTPIPDVARLRRSSLVDVGLDLARTVPATGHVAPVPVGGLIQH
jgi:8-oxo-dGTP diphosphatase